jgi:serine/threonine protein kinase
MKTANVLLDADGSAKVADFGTSRKGVSHASDKTHATTALVAGTQCYMPPEYTQNGHCSEKTDAYAFGIILLELLTGKLSIEVASMNYEDEDLHENMAARHTDATAGAWAAGAVEAMAKASRACLEFRSQKRASVRSVLPALEAAAAEHA